jgi:hypothetical protein
METPKASATIKMNKKTGQMTLKKLKLKAPYSASGILDGDPTTRKGKVTGKGKQ